MMRRCATFGVGLFLAITLALAPAPALAQGSVTTVEFYSPAVDRTMKYNIVLPYGYVDSDLEYPVIYLLHGITQNYTVWAQMGVPFYADMYNVIVVMPDGGNSWYINYAESAGGQTNNWEDHIVRDVVGHVDANYRTIERREGRAIAGLSMGGYGSITMGLRNPDLFVSIGSTSGALEYGRQGAAALRRGEPRNRREGSTEPNPAIGIDGFSSQTERSPLGREFVTAEQADQYDPFVLIHQLPADQVPHIYLDCGTEDGLIDGARELAGILIEKNLPFDYMQMDGRHNGAYWTQSVGRIIPVQYEVIRRALGERPVAVRRG
ncbi:MAG: alpha/beta hydrolase-fold protein [Gemmatimonadota bacterium]|nr:alpha/beta hydrolase-fold protein [Gemmatimonadota bacterium]